MKIWVNVLALLVLIASLVAGKMYWDHQASEQSAVRPTKIEGSSYTKGEEASWKKYAQNLPKSVIAKIEQAEKTQKPIKLVIVGSAPKEKVQKTWGTLLKENLKSTYGEDLMDTQVYEYTDMTTLKFINNGTYKQILDEKPDVLLFEPFLLNDNGVVGIDNTLENITVIISHLKDQNSELVTILQPSAPVYKAENYPNDVKALEEFSKENGYEYLSHWNVWPDYRSKAILTFLGKTSGQPNDKGEQLWAKYLEAYFTNSPSEL
ncbi:SGNH/GDSL hydrolase family protein [Priestia megaterium]|uniref:SGNH/GDSL hydrolase family protein n=1 Tax=Priestia megaterium TaxID=1404 RepID=UPI001E48D2BF|nr:SGNH/GDSL hydrolase family protein [Priestia megaterium]